MTRCGLGSRQRHYGGLCLLHIQPWREKHHVSQKPWYLLASACGFTNQHKLFSITVLQAFVSVSCIISALQISLFPKDWHGFHVLLKQTRVTLTTYLHLVQRSRKSGAIPPLPEIFSWRGSEWSTTDNFTLYAVNLASRKSNIALFASESQVHDSASLSVLSVYKATLKDPLYRWHLMPHI
jgi:hypothetical protein